MDLSQSSNMLEILIDRLDDGLIIADSRGQIIQANAATEQLFGYPLQELVGQNLRMLMPEPDAGNNDGYMQRYLAGGIPHVIGYERNVVGLHKNGQRLQLLLKVGEFSLLGERHFVGLLRALTDDIAQNKALQQATLLNRQVLEYAPHAIIATDVDGTISMFNPAAERLLGYAAEELVGRLTPACFHDLQEVAQRAEQFSHELGLPLQPGFDVLVAKSRLGLANEHEWTYIRKDGQRLPVQLSIDAIRDEQGRICGFLGNAIDISTRRQAEADLKFSTDLLAAVAKLQQTFIVSQNRQQTFDQMLQDLLTLTSSTYGFIGEVLRSDEERPYLKTHAITNIAWDDATRHFYSANAPQGLEFRNLNTLFGHTIRTGETVISNHPASDPRAGGLPPGHPAMNSYLGLPLMHGGLMVGMVGIANRPGGYDQALADELLPLLNVAAQIIVNLRTATAQQQAATELAQAEQRWQFALEGSGDGVWDWDVVENNVFFSKHWKAILGYHEHEVGTTLEDWSSRVHPDDLPLCMADLERHFSGQTPVYINEYRIRHKDGHWLWVLDRGMVVKWLAPGKPARLIGTHSDISARKAAEAELRRAMARAEDANRAKSQFLANMSHEIRTPMNAVLGLTHLLQQTSLDRQQLDYASKIDRSGRALLALLNNVLDLAKIDAGKLTLEHAPFNLQNILENLAAIAAGSAQQRDLELIFHIAPETPMQLTGDGMRLQQVLTNLVGNAIKFTEQGEVALHIWPLAKTDDEAEIGFAIRDSGIGITAEQQQQIFDRFAQADSATTRRFGGSGLGLAICRELVQLMGGEINLHSQLGQGAEFRFSLHFKYFTAPPLQQQSLQGKRLLLVDEHRNSLRALVNLAATAGLDVTACNSAQQALANEQEGGHNDEQRFDAMLINWRLSNGDGIALSRQLRQRHPHARQILMFSAFAREQFNAKLAQEEHAFDGVLTKPVTLIQLQQALTGSKRSQAARPLRRLQGLRLLLVEDNPLNQQVATELLQLEGANVTTADNGQIAVELVGNSAQPFDAVLMDLQMPVMDGLQATRLIRQMPASRQLPIFAMTANVMAGDRSACIDAGMDGHIGKPIDLQLLLATLGPIVPAASAPSTVERATVISVNPSQQPPLINREAAINRLGGNSGLYQQLIGRFCQQYAQWQGAAAVWQGNDQPCRQREFHSIKGVAATLGAEQLAAIAARLEQHAKAGDSAVSQQLAEFDQCLAQTLAQFGVAQDESSTAEATATTVESAATMGDDSPQLQAQWQQLRQALCTGDLAALALAEQLAGQAADLPWMSQLQSSVSALAFAEALQLLEQHRPRNGAGA